MKEYDRVKLIAEKDKYAKEGVHKDMDGWICDPRNINGQWLVCFDQYGDLPNIATIPIKEKDLEVIWDCPVKQAGSKVTLYVSNYINKGVPLGAQGTIIKKCDDAKKWVVCFNVDGLQQEILLTVNNDEISIDLE